jgi:hypothetical protein
MLLTNDLREDGFGAQYQSILWSILLAEVNGHIFLYSDIPHMDNPTSNSKQFLEDAVQEMNIKGKFRPVDTVGKQLIFAPKWPFFYGEIETNMEKYHSSDSFKKLQTLYFENKTTPYDTNHTHVAVHIRRPMRFDTGTMGSDTPNTYYTNQMRRIQDFFKEASKPLLFHIFSQGKESDFQELIEFPVKFHLDDDTFQTFRGFVFADILITSKSSFSYVGALLSKGIIFYKPFWHPPRAHWTIFPEE